MTDLPFAGRVALVTGGSRGIGRATALRLAAEGADVAISYVTRHEAAEEVLAAVRALGRHALAVPCNVAHKEEVDRLVGETAATLGPVDLLAHCGAISNVCSHAELDLERWRETLNVNLTGTYLVTFAVKDSMIERGFGRIVTLSSVAALAPRQMQLHYSAAKAGVIAFTRCLAEALAPHNVRVNCVAPGIVETEMVHMLPDDHLERVIAATPMGRIGEPEEIAGTIRFLLGEDSSYMTGQTLCPSGGRVMVP
jgi:3-oxoacyl-[acyl-carrier protein] reductase